MRSIIRHTFLVLFLGTVCSSEAQETTLPSGAEGTVYRCMLADGSRRYTSKIIPGVECVAVSAYRQHSAPPASPPGWTHVTSSAIADTYIQSRSIKRNGVNAFAWVMETYSGAQTNRYVRAPFQSALRRVSVKCAERYVSLQKTTFTSEPFGRGEYVGEFRPLGEFGDFATPGSIDDAVAAYVCRKK